jgi:hypothetical protein
MSKAMRQARIYTKLDEEYRWTSHLDYYLIVGGLSDNSLIDHHQRALLVTVFFLAECNGHNIRYKYQKKTQKK